MGQGLLVIISGPSGAGKGSIYNGVLEKMSNIKKSISVTTRSPRAHEEDGVHYYFKTVEEYQQMIANGEFLETASVYSNLYGTPKAAVFDLLNAGNDVMFEIDINGAKQIKKKYNNCISIYILAPSLDELEKRLRDRGTETEESVTRRLGSAKSELKQYSMFDYVVFNEDLETSINKVIGIIASEKCKTKYNENKILEMLKD